MSRLRTNIITNRMANGAPTVSNGLVISGVTTTSQILVGNSIKLDPVSGISTFTEVKLDDNNKLNFGGSSDLQLWHNGSHSNIKNSTGRLYILANDIWIKDGDDGDFHARFLHDDASELYFNGGKKLETTNTGVTVTGVVAATSFSGSGEGLTRTTAYSHRNVVINGAMQVAQRGSTSTGNTVGGYKTCDRWELALTSAGTWTVTRSGTCPDGFNHSIKLDCTTANTSLSATSFLSIRTAFEGQDLRRFAKGTTSAKAMTVSFYVKTNKNGTYAVELYDVDNTKIATSLYTVSNSNWNRYEFTIPASTNTGQFVNDNNKSLTLGFILAAGTNYTNGTQYGTFVQGSNLNRAAGLTVNLADSTSNEFYLTGVQMEEGEITTPFEHRTYHDEFLRCCRYYQELTGNDHQHKGSSGTSGSFKNCVIGAYNGDADVRVTHYHTVPMRVNPTMTTSAMSHFDLEPFDQEPASISLLRPGNTQSTLIIVPTNQSSHRGFACQLTLDNASANITFDSEL